MRHPSGADGTVTPRQIRGPSVATLRLCTGRHGRDSAAGNVRIEDYKTAGVGLHDRKWCHGTVNIAMSKLAVGLV